MSYPGGGLSLKGTVLVIDGIATGFCGTMWLKSGRAGLSFFLFMTFLLTRGSGSLEPLTKLFSAREGVEGGRGTKLRSSE